jgi:hypothetical protein
MSRLGRAQPFKPQVHKALAPSVVDVPIPVGSGLDTLTGQPMAMAFAILMPPEN